MKKRANARARPAKPSTTVSVAEPPARLPMEATRSPATFRVRLGRFLILTAGVLVTHFVLFAPALIGRKVLLPLDCLAAPNAYLPSTPQYAEVKPGNNALLDQVLQFEFQRRFAAEEFRAGRVPLWDPYHYCGAPFVAPFLSPFNVPYYLFPGYVTWAWIHVLVSLVAAGGAYLFFRRVLGIGFWPAVVAAWCFPLTAFFQYWLGYYLTFTAAFLPWLLVAVDSTIRRPAGFGAPGLALATGLILVSGAFDLAGQALLAAGLFAVWRLGETFLIRRQWKDLLAPVGALTAAWVLGFLLAAPYWMPLTEYAATGLRMQRRAENTSERPPIGATALPQMFLPFFYGLYQPDWPWLSASPNILESGAQAYCGLVAMLVLAPLGLASRRSRSLTVFWGLMCVLSSSWVLSLWPLTAILQLPVLNMMSHNRFLFVFCFATLSLAALGLESILRGEIRWAGGFVLPASLVACFFIWCMISSYTYIQSLVGPKEGDILFDICVMSIVITAAVVAGFFFSMWLMPPAWRSGLFIPILILAGLGVWSVVRAAEVTQIVPDEAFANPSPELTPAQVKENAAALAREPRANLQSACIQAALFCLAGVLVWPLVFRTPPRVAAVVVSVTLIADLLWSARFANPQHDPALFYPSIPAMEELKQREPKGRIVGIACFPPLVPQRFGFLDVRGYDAVDPARIVNLLLRAKDPNAPTYPYTAVQWWYPPLTGDPLTRKFKMLPVLNMLNLRYVIGKGQSTIMDIFNPLIIGYDEHRDDYWIYENRDALPRVFVPHRVEVSSEARTLKRLTDVSDRLTGIPEAFAFDPKEIAYVESDVNLRGECQGDAEITHETPCEIHVAVDMKTPGLLVLGDQWYTGWHATYEGRPLPVMPVNATIRGVVLPAGKGEVVFRYEPTGWARGIRTFAIAFPVLLAWFATSAWFMRRVKPISS